MSDYRLGVLGGMGPQATNTFYQYIIDRTAARTDQEHISMLIFSDNEVPDRTAAILSGEEDPVYDRLLYSAKLLEQGGCTAIAVPCNTAHYFLDKVQEQISIPILHMVREACQVLASRGCHYPGVLGTDGTIQTGIYQKELIALGMEPRVPSPEAQKKVMSLIYDDIKAGKAGDPEKFAVVHQDLEEQGCDCAILACTELSVFSSQHHLPPFYLDAMAVLAERSIQACHGRLQHIFTK